MEVDLVMLMRERAWSKDEMAKLQLQVTTVMEMFKTFREQVAPMALVLQDPNARDEMAQLRQQVRMLTDKVETLRRLLKFPIPFVLLSMDTSSIPYIITDTAYSMFYLLFRTSVFVCTEVLSLFDSCLVELSL